MITHLRPVSADLPELSLARWEALDPANVEALRFERGLLLAYAEAYDADVRIASAWSADERQLLGVSFGARYEALGAGRVMRSLSNPLHLDHGPICRGLRLHHEADPAAVVPALIEAWKEQCRADGIQRLVILDCDPRNASLRELATAAGGRELAGPLDSLIRLERPTPFEEFLHGLPDNKMARSLRKDLRRPAEAAAEIVSVPPTRANLERAWPLELEHLERYRVRFRPREGVNLFTLIGTHAPTDNLELLFCQRGETLLGSLLTYRVGATTHMMYIGHLPDEPLQVYVSLVAARLKQDLDRGVTTIRFGYSAETYKKRVGALGEPRVHYYFAVS